MQIMTTRYAILLLVMTAAAALVQPAGADTIVLHSGEKFTSQMVWEEGQKIRFNMQGLLVSVHKSEIAAVLDEDGAPRFFGAATPAEPVSAPAQTAPPKVDDAAPAAPPAQPQQASAGASDQNQTPPPSRPDDAPPRISGTGLKGILWQMQPEKIGELVFSKSDPDYGGIDYYYRPDDPMQLDQARLDGVNYGFWRNRLYAIVFWVQGPPGYRELKEVIFKHYGTGTRSATGMERYIWRCEDTDRMLEFDKSLNTGFFWMRSRALDQQIKALYPHE